MDRSRRWRPGPGMGSQGVHLPPQSDHSMTAGGRDWPLFRNPAGGVGHSPARELRAASPQGSYCRGLGRGQTVPVGPVLQNGGGSVAGPRRGAWGDALLACSGVDVSAAPQVTGAATAQWPRRPRLAAWQGPGSSCPEAPGAAQREAARVRRGGRPTNEDLDADGGDPVSSLAAASRCDADVAVSPQGQQSAAAVERAHADDAHARRAARRGPAAAEDSGTPRAGRGRPRERARARRASAVRSACSSVRPVVGLGWRSAKPCCACAWGAASPPRRRTLPGYGRRWLLQPHRGPGWRAQGTHAASPGALRTPRPS